MVLAQRLNFTQAADDLFMAQPALSRLISALEKELDLQLFYRNSRSVRSCVAIAGSTNSGNCKIADPQWIGYLSCHIRTLFLPGFGNDFLKR